MATQISPAIAKDLANVIEMIKKNGGTIATNQKNYKTWFDGLKKANVDGTAEQIDMNQSRLKKVVELMDKDIYGVNAALSLLSQLAKDDGLMEAKGAVVKALTDKMSDTQKQLSRELADARAEDAKADKASAAAKKGAQAAESGLDELKTQSDELNKLVLKGTDDLPKMVAAANDADAKHDKNALTKARLRVIEIKGLDTPAGNLKRKLDAYKKNFPEIDRAMASDRDEVERIVNDATDLAKEADKQLKPLLDLHAIAPPQPKANGVHTALGKAEIHKIALQIHVDVKDEPKLLKMLQVTPFEKWQVGLTHLVTSLKLVDDHGKPAKASLMIEKLKKTVPAFKKEWDKKSKEMLIDI